MVLYQSPSTNTEHVQTTKDCNHELIEWVDGIKCTHKQNNTPSSGVDPVTILHLPG